MSDMSADLIDARALPGRPVQGAARDPRPYHVTDASSFYSGDDEWATPNDPTQPTGHADRPQPPYYLTMQVPGTDAPAFTLYSTYIPKSTASDDVAERAHRLPGGRTPDAGPGLRQAHAARRCRSETRCPAPARCRTNFNSDTDGRQRSSPCCDSGRHEVTRGNLLTLPVGGGLLYVQPVYVQSTRCDRAIRCCARCSSRFGDKIAFEDTLDAALDTLFGGDSGASAGDNGAGGPAGTGTGTGSGTGRTAPARAREPAPAPRTTPALQKALADVPGRRSPTARGVRRATTWSRRRRPTRRMQTPSARRIAAGGVTIGHLTGITSAASA